MTTVPLMDLPPLFLTDERKREKDKSLQERGIQSNLKDFAAFRYLCQLKSPFFQSNMLADHIGAVEKLFGRFDA
jgi:hypothetical protein